MSDLCKRDILRADGKTVYPRRMKGGLRRTRIVVRKRHNRSAPRP